MTPEDVSGAMLEIRRHVEMGLLAFPVILVGQPKPTKKPIEKGWQTKVWDLGMLEDRILSEPKCIGYGLTQPRANPRRLVDLDLDDGGEGLQPGQPSWRERLAAIEAEFGPLPVTKTTATPGGEHRWFIWPDDEPLPEGTWHGFTVRKLYQAKNFVVGPGSVRPDGLYVNVDPTVPIATMPVELARSGIKHKATGVNGTAPGEFKPPYQLPDSIDHGDCYPAVVSYTLQLWNNRLSIDEIWSLVRTVLGPKLSTPHTDEHLRQHFDAATADLATKYPRDERGRVLDTIGFEPSPRPEPREAPVEADPIAAAELAKALDDIHEFYTRFIYFPKPEQLDALVLWVAYTHWFGRDQDAFSFVPYTLVTSAEKQSGKSTALEISGMLAHRPLVGQNVSAATIGRTCGGRTLLLDEIDGVYSNRRDGDDPGATDLRTILNAGFKYDGTYDRLNLKTMKPESFSVFGPKMLVGIGRSVPDTVTDRSISIRLERKAPDVKRDKFRERHQRKAIEAFRERLVKLAELIVLSEIDIDSFPAKLDGRREDIWEPLYALALAAGAEWYARCVRASEELTDIEQSVSLGVQLLDSIRDLFEQLKNPNMIATRSLIGQPENPRENEPATGLCAMEEAPWATFTRGKPITPHRVALLLGEFDISPHREATGEHSHGPKGYWRIDFEKAWKLYLSDTNDPSATSDTSVHERERHPDAAPATSDTSVHERERHPDAAPATSDTSVHERERAETDTTHSRMGVLLSEKKEERVNGAADDPTPSSSRSNVSDVSDAPIPLRDRLCPSCKRWHPALMTCQQAATPMT